jgi:hypothetical protein
VLGLKARPFQNALVERGEHMTVTSEADQLRSESRDVLPHLSDTVKQMPPHDVVAIAFHDQHGQPVVEASTGDFPAIKPHLLPVTRFDSVLSVPAWAANQDLGVAFWSKQPNAFGSDDLTLTHRIGGLREARHAAKDQAQSEKREGYRDAGY